MHFKHIHYLLVPGLTGQRAPMRPIGNSCPPCPTIGRRQTPIVVFDLLLCSVYVYETVGRLAIDNLCLIFLWLNKKIWFDLCNDRDQWSAQV